ILEVSVHGEAEVDGNEVVGFFIGTHALVTFSEAKDAATAVNSLNDTIVMGGQWVHVKWATLRDQRVGFYAKVSNLPPTTSWHHVNDLFDRVPDKIWLKPTKREAILR
ncbi:unnamed protein product, partial [Ectocarpus fasciculatus]